MNQNWSLETEMKLIYLIVTLPLGTCSLAELILMAGRLNWASGFVFTLVGNNNMKDPRRSQGNSEAPPRG